MGTAFRKLFLFIAALTAAGLLVFFLGALLLPREYSVSRAVTIAARPETIFAELRDLRNWPRWAAWYDRDEEMAVRHLGLPGEIGARQKWSSERYGQGQIEIVSMDPPQRIEFAIFQGEAREPSFAAFTLRPEGSRTTTVTWTVRGETLSPRLTNPLGPWLTLLFGPVAGGDLQRSLLKLKGRVEALEESSRPPRISQPGGITQ